MNDSLESTLRALKPGKLPASLAASLADPPTPQPTARILLAGFAVTAAACVVAFLSLSNSPDPISEFSAPSLASGVSHQVTGVEPLELVMDDSNQPWQLIAVQWVEQTTIVSAAHPMAVQVEDHFSTVVPVAISFD